MVLRKGHRFLVAASIHPTMGFVGSLDELVVLVCWCFQLIAFQLLGVDEPINRGLAIGGLVASFWCLRKASAGTSFDVPPVRPIAHHSPLVPWLGFCNLWYWILQLAYAAHDPTFLAPIVHHRLSTGRQYLSIVWVFLGYVGGSEPSFALHKIRLATMASAVICVRLQLLANALPRSAEGVSSDLVLNGLSAIVIPKMIGGLLGIITRERLEASKNALADESMQLEAERERAVCEKERALYDLALLEKKQRVDYNCITQCGESLEVDSTCSETERIFLASSIYYPKATRA